MEITIINGSPKMDASISGQLIEYLTYQLSNEKAEIYSINKGSLTEPQMEKVKNSQVLVFAFPLYVDGIPSHLLRFLVALEEQKRLNKETMVYCIVNNGFFEGKQNHIAIAQMKHWCHAVGLKWGMAIGVGAGEMLPFIKKVPLGYGPNKNLGNAIRQLSFHISNQSSGKSIFISPNWPRFLWRIQASAFWVSRGKANGLKKV